MIGYNIYRTSIKVSTITLKVIVETFIPNNENGSDEVIVRAAKGIEPDIKDLLR